MVRSCVLIPRVTNRQGKKVSSKLYKDLLSFTFNDREESNRIYQITKTAVFKRDWIPRLILDNNNEPTLVSLLKVTNLGKFIPNEKILERLNRRIGYYKRGMDRAALWINNNSNYHKLRQRAIEFNQNSEFREDYVANVIKIQDTESNGVYIGVKVERRDKFNSVDASKMEYNERLNNRLKDILESWGISIGVLTDLENRRGINGVTDFSAAKDAATGIVELIRLASGINGEKALPEEFAHVAIEAMGDHPLITRLINSIISNDLIKEIMGKDYDTYNILYEGDKFKLAKEAAGKLLAKHFLQNEKIQQKPYKNILERLIQAVKNFFKRLDATPIQKAIQQADKEFGSLAKQILDGSLDNVIDVNNIHSDELFYSTSERVSRDKKLLQGIIDNELKRLKIYEKRNPNSKFSITQKQLIDKLQKQLDSNLEIEGIYTFIEDALGELKKINNRINTLQNTPATTANERARVMRDVRNYLYSYKHIMEDIRDALLDEEQQTDNRYGERIRVVLDNTTILLDDLFSRYTKIAMPLFVDFIKPFIGESIIVPFGKLQGKKMEVEDLIKKADKDITIFDKWLDSMADSSDYMLKVMDQAVKESKENARLETLNIKKELQAATIELEQAGVQDTEWMFEKDEDGNLTGYYISDTNWGAFAKNYNEMSANLIAKYGEHPLGEQARKYKKEKHAWIDANTELINGRRVPRKWKDEKNRIPLYANLDFENLRGPKKAYYTKIMEIKRKLDALLPEKYTTLTSAVKIRKDLVQRVKSSDGIKSGTKQIWESIKDDFIRRSDDTEFGDRAILQDFEKREVQILPVYYTKLRKGESPNDISTDITSTLTAYAAMANDYNEMSKIINLLELGRDILRERDIKSTEGENQLVEKFTSLGRKIESALTKSGNETNFMQRLNSFFEMQVYQRYMADEGTFGNTKIDKGKAINFVNKLTSLNVLAINILAGISNVTTGTVMMRVESLSGEFFTESNTFKADRTYGSALPEFLAEIGNRVKISKLALWDELFNVMQEYDTKIRDSNFDRKTWFSRMFGTSALFLTNNAGEHWMQNRTSLALADAYKMKAPNGKIVSLWEAMEVVYIDENNKKLGARLQVKPGYTKEDGSEFTKKDISAFSKRTTAINERMHGIYNKADKNAIQNFAIGRMGIMFRKWIKPSLNKRFKSVSYNYDLDAWTEGYYKTAGRFIVKLIKEMKEGQFALAANWNTLSKTEKANLKRAAVEVGHLLVIALVMGLINWPDDDDDRPWLIAMIEYQTRRLYTEIGSLVPGPQMLNEGLKILKSPAAGINVFEDLLNLAGLLNPANYEIFSGDDALIQAGRYKGESKATKLFFQSPLIPMNKTIYNDLHPEEAIPFFKQ